MASADGEAEAKSVGRGKRDIGNRYELRQGNMVTREACIGRYLAWQLRRREMQCNATQRNAGSSMTQNEKNTRSKSKTWVHHGSVQTSSASPVLTHLIVAPAVAPQTWSSAPRVLGVLYAEQPEDKVLQGLEYQDEAVQAPGC